MCYYGLNNKIFSIMPHHLEIGRFMRDCAILDLEKKKVEQLMGLAPYGKPVFLIKNVGNKYILKKIIIINL